MIAITIAARGFGYIREAVIASAYGASIEVDLFLTAVAVPGILITTVYYSIPNAFVPLWSSPAHGHRRAISAAASVAAVSVVLALAIAILALPIMQFIASGFTPDLRIRAAFLTRIGAGCVVFAVLEALLRSRLLASKQFGWPSLSYVWQGIGIIVAVLGWRDRGADSLMWGLLVGSAASVAWNAALLASSQTGKTAPPIHSLTTVAVPRIWLWVTLVLLTDSLSQLYSVIDRHLGTFLEPGAIAALNYAGLVAGLPSAVIGIALSTAIFPFLSEAAAGRDDERTLSIIHRAVSWSLLFAVPFFVWMTIFRSEIIGILFQRGAFDSRARELTSAALAATAIGIVPLALATVWSRIFYAARRWRPILFAASIALIAKTLLSMWWVALWGLTGLALATSCAYATAAIAIGMIQKDRMRGPMREWSILSLKILILVGLPALAFRGILWSMDEGLPLIRYTLAGAGIASGILTSIAIGGRWGISQMTDLRNYIRPRKD